MTPSYSRKNNLFVPGSKEPYRLSRFRLETFLNCPRCFYLDRRLGIDVPPMPGFTLNSAVDALLKKEFDIYRRKKEPHPLMEKYHIRAVPFAHKDLDVWRDNFKGLRHSHQPSHFIFFGAVDDIWVDEGGTLYVVDYKSTSTQEPLSLNGQYKEAYKRQMDMYQWLLRKQGFTVSPNGYFVYCNADKSVDAFDAQLQFRMEILSYQGNDSWVEEALVRAYQCLMQEALPESTDTCPYCCYRKSCQHIEQKKKASSREPKEIQQRFFL